MINNKCFLVPVLLFSLLSVISAENIRGPVSGIADFTGSDILTIETRIESLVGIRLSSSLSPLVQGVKVTVSAQEAMALYRNSFALYLYRDLDKSPDVSENSYRGTQSYMRFLDFDKPVSFLIPLNSNHTLSPDRSSYLISEESKKEDFPLLMTILPVTKGIPDAVYNEKITFSFEPIYFNKGSLRVKISDNEGNPVDDALYFQIDGKMQEDLRKTVILDAGLHTLIIRSDSGIEDTLQFALSAGESLVLDHILQQQYPTLRIDTIEGMSVFLDGKPVEPEKLSRSFEIQPGKHIIRFTIGDYQLSREFLAEMQDSYRITMIPEILLEKQ